MPYSIKGKVTSRGRLLTGAKQVCRRVVMRPLPKMEMVSSADDNCQDGDDGGDGGGDGGGC